MKLLTTIQPHSSNYLSSDGPIEIYVHDAYPNHYFESNGSRRRYEWKLKSNDKLDDPDSTTYALMKSNNCFGDECYHYKNGKLHHDIYPASTFNNCHVYYNHGLIHRLEGPAIQRWCDQNRVCWSTEYWIHGTQLTETEFQTEKRKAAVFWTFKRMCLKDVMNPIIRGTLGPDKRASPLTP